MAHTGMQADADAVDDALVAGRSLKARLRDLLARTDFQRTIVALIVVNAVLLGLETSVVRVSWSGFTPARLPRRRMKRGVSACVRRLQVSRRKSQASPAFLQRNSPA